MKSEKINEYLLKITGAAYLGDEIDPSLVLKIKDGNITIYEVSKKDNDDGSFDIIYKGRFTEAIEFEQAGKAVRGRDKTSESRKTRYCIKAFASDLGEGDSEEFYRIFQQKLRTNIDAVWDLLKTL